MGIARKLHNLTHPVIGHILMLHSVTEQPLDSRLEITPARLKESIEHYRQCGWDAVSLDEAARRISQHDRRRFVCYTFDDGYLDTLTLAYPILKETATPFCVYMTRDFYRSIAKPVWNPSAPILDTEQLRQLAADPLCTVGCHTCSHPRLSTLADKEQQNELADCKIDLEQLLGTKILHLAYPHGDYNAETLPIVKELGFTTAVTTSGRPVRTDTRLHELDRLTLS